MSVLCVVPCLNESDHLSALIQQLLRDQTIDVLVVADGGSTDGSQRIVLNWVKRDDRVRLLDNPDRIQSAGINRAVEKFGKAHKWLVRVDAHCRYPEGYVGLLLKAANERAATCVVVPMVTEAFSGWQSAIAKAQNSVLGTGGSAHRHMSEGHFVEHGHHALMRVENFRKAGGYCEAMPCNEDAELDHRLGNEGAKIWLEPSAAIVYYPRTTLGSLARQYYRYGVGRARTVLRHRMRLRMRQLLPLAVPVSLGLLPLAFLHPIFSAPFLLWFFATLGAGVLIGSKEGGWNLLAGVAAGVMHMSWGLGFFRECLFNPRGVKPTLRLKPNSITPEPTREVTG